MAALPSSNSSVPVSSTAQRASCTGCGRARPGCRCSRPMRCSSRSIGHNSVASMSKSMSSDCSSTCVPTTISRSRCAGVERLPMRSIMRCSFSARSGIKNCAWNTSTSNPGSSSRRRAARSCAFRTVLTITPAQPPSRSAFCSISGRCSSVRDSIVTRRGGVCSGLPVCCTCFPSVQVSSG